MGRPTLLMGDFMADTFRIDSTKIHFHPQRVAQWMESKDEWELAKSVYPIYAEVTTSAACNHRCSFCSVDAIGYPQIMIDRAKLKSAMTEMGENGVKSVMFAGTGEPLLHKGINQIVHDARGSGLDVAFTTNAVLLHKLDAIAECQWVKISMNAGTRESYAAIHQTNPKDWDSIWRHLPAVIARRGECKVGVQCVVLPENYTEMAELAARAKGVGADYLVLKPYSQATFSIVQRGDIDYRTMQHELDAVKQYATPSFEVIVRTNAITNEITGKHSFDKCRATPFTWAYLMADGRVFTCSAHLLDPTFCIGNINDASFKEIWEGDGRRAQWEKMQTFDIANCRLSCRMAQTNIYLEQLDLGVPHGNFI